MNGKMSSKNSRKLNYSFISENVNAFILKFGKVSSNNKKKKTVSKFVQRLWEMIVLAVWVAIKLAELLLVFFGARGFLPVSQILLRHLTERMLPKPTLKHPLNEMALRQQFGGRAEGAYQSLNCCLTALQHKTHLIEKMADKPCEILRPQGERRSTLLLAGAVSEDLSFSCCCCTILLAVVSCISFFFNVVLF